MPRAAYTRRSTGCRCAAKSVGARRRVAAAVSPCAAHANDSHQGLRPAPKSPQAARAHAETPIPGGQIESRDAPERSLSSRRLRASCDSASRHSSLPGVQPAAMTPLPKRASCAVGSRRHGKADHLPRSILRPSAAQSTGAPPPHSQSPLTAGRSQRGAGAIHRMVEQPHFDLARSTAAGAPHPRRPGRNSSMCRPAHPADRASRPRAAHRKYRKAAPRGPPSCGCPSRSQTPIEIRCQRLGLAPASSASMPSAGKRTLLIPAR